jgi:nucleoside-diphosphate-sugar epimerase
MRLLLDEMYPAHLARALRERGLDVAGVDERDPLKGLADEELLVIAAREERAVVSENVSDFMRLYGEWAAAGREHAGVVIALSSRFSRTPAGWDALINALAELRSERSDRDALRNSVHFLVRP